MKKDYYLVLRLTPQATAKEIQSAYRRRAIELHPDVSGFDSDQFLELHEAYSVLSDPMRRAVYDREAQRIPIRHIDTAWPAENAIRRKPSAEPLSPARPSFLQPIETVLPSFNEIFGRFWSNFESTRAPETERLRNLAVELSLSPREAFAGGKMRILLPLHRRCPACRGQGHLGPYHCSRCGGSGAFRDEYPVIVSYPARLQQDYVVHLLLDEFGNENLCLTVRFRLAEPIW